MIKAVYDHLMANYQAVDQWHQYPVDESKVEPPYGVIEPLMPQRSVNNVAGGWHYLRLSIYVDRGDGLTLERAMRELERVFLGDDGQPIALKDPNTGDTLRFEYVQGPSGLLVEEETQGRYIDFRAPRLVPR